MIGLMGTKIGMSQIFDAEGGVVPITLIKVEPNILIGKRGKKRDGYSAHIFAFGNAKKVRKPVAGQFPEGVKPLKNIYEIRDCDLDIAIGDSLTVSIFSEVLFVDVQGITKGKGFQGVMRRHGFHGGPKTHGSKFHRQGGSTGMAEYPGHIIKGTKMAGRQGAELHTVQSLRLITVDVEKNYLFVRGSVPGVPHQPIFIRKAKKK